MKKVLVTGASRGIGKSVAELYKQKGYYVIGTASQDIKQLPIYLDEYRQCDLSENHSLENFASYVESKQIDILINNAGINIINNFCDIDPADFQKIQQVNVYAPFRISQSVIPSMRKSGWGRIVSVSSVWGKKSKAGRASYSTSKFAIDGLTLSIANEFAKENILCNSVAPGFIDTEMTHKNLGPIGISKILENVPINRLAKVTEVAEFIVWLGSEHNTYITGQNLPIDGGFTRA
jgi:3-oxoacyl-[acyl-carrier protein] reductase